MPSVAELIAPSDERSFFANYWQKEPLVIHRGAPSIFDDLFSLRSVDTILAASDLRLPAFRLVKDGVELPATDYTNGLAWGASAFEGAADVDKVLEFYRAGATIVLQALHRSWSPVRDFCRSLEKRLNHPVQANAYLTPRGSQGFRPHYDTHDVFILQVSGLKRWRLYGSPVLLPHESQKFDPATMPIGEPRSEFDLNAGDVIYIPRGFVHEGLTTDSHSLHLTIGIPAVTWIDVCMEALKSCILDPEFRTALPVGFAEDSCCRAELLAGFHERLKRLVTSIDTAALYGAVADKYVSAIAPDRKDSLLDVEMFEAPGATTTFVRRPNVVSRITDEHGLILLRFEGKKMSFPAFCKQTLDQVSSATTEFCANDLPPNIDLDGRLALLRRLLREGYICRSAPTNY